MISYNENFRLSLFYFLGSCTFCVFEIEKRRNDKKGWFSLKKDCK